MKKKRISNLGVDGFVHCKKLGTPKTVGELVSLLEQYDQDMEFGFRNQPTQSLYEVKYTEGTAVLFQ